jgi:ketosteroid isomerase-like protein
MPSTSDETMRRLLDLVLAKDMDAVADLWAEDGTAEFPFAVGTSPRRLVGREEVRGYLAGFPEVYDLREIPAMTVHHTHNGRTPSWWSTRRTGARCAPESPIGWTTSW